MNQKLTLNAILCTVLVFGSMTSHGANIIVTNVSDSGVGSFRQAMASALSGDTIRFDESTDNMQIVLSTGEIVVDKSISIIGNGSNVSIISGNSTNRILNLTNAGIVTLSDIALVAGFSDDRGGAIMTTDTELQLNNVLIQGCEASGGTATQGGGGIANIGGTVTITSFSKIVDNMASGTSGSGGGILNIDGGILTVTNSMIKGNRSNRAGGGIEDNNGGMISLTNVQLDSNITASAPGNGGGLHITGAGNASIIGGTIMLNSAASEGGGLWNGAGNMSIDSAIISGNIASGGDADQGGGGIYNLSGMLAINNALISNNIADGASGSGGGILNDAGASLMVMNTIITGNQANRAGGGIEDNSGAETELSLLNVTLTENSTGSAPGNGGALHITGAGNVTIQGGMVNQNSAAAEGGGIWNGAGTMTIDSTLISANIASGSDADQGGGGIYNLSGILLINNASIVKNIADGASGSGGGILNDVGGTLMVSNSSISNNQSNRAGGGIEDNSGTGSEISLRNVVLDSNSTGSAPGNGGGLHITGPGNSKITGGAITNNSAMREGGGLWNGSGQMSISGVMIRNNESFGSGIDDGGAGAFNNGGTLQITSTTISANFANGEGNGGGLHNNNGIIWIERSTISGNTAGSSGGAIHNLGILNIYASTVVRNTSTMTGAGLSQFAMTDTIKMGSSILAENLTSGTGMDISSDSGIIISTGFNLVGVTDIESMISDTTNITGTIEVPVDPLVAELADNGGWTNTHALLCTSPAINSGDTSLILDQRDSMVFEGRRDIGSFELQIDCETTPVLEENSELFGTLIFPNPSNGTEVNVKLPGSVTGKYQIRIFELTSGKSVFHSTAADTEISIQLSEIASGAYVIQVLTDESIFQRKLVINK